MYLPLMCVEDARSAARFADACVATIGLGYHPDTPFSDYIDATGTPLFTSDESARLDLLTERGFSYCGDTLYDIGATAQQRLLGRR